MATNEKWLRLSNGVEIELRFEGEAFLGLGEIRAASVPVRSGAWPLRPQIATAEGLRYERLELIETVQEDGGYLLRVKLIGSAGGPHPRFDYYRPMISTELPDTPVEDLLEWRLAPLRQEIGSETWEGMSYSYRFLSDQRRIHRLLDWGTWEVGGRAEGNLLISRACFSPVEAQLTRAGRYTTSEEYGPSADDVEGTFMQLRPRFGAMQCFDYEWNPRGSLLLAWDRPDYINGLVHKEAGSDWVQVIDEHWFELTGDARPPARWVLFRPAGREETVWEGRTRWMRCWQWSREHYGHQVGIAPVRAPLMYQVEATPALGRPETGIAISEHLRDVILPRAAQLGFEAVFFGPRWQCALAEDLPGTLNNNAHSICAPYDYRFAEQWGGDKLMREVCDTGKRLGVAAMPWLAAHITTLFPDSPLLKDHPDYLVRDIFGGHYSGGYAEIASGDLAGGFGDRWFECLRHNVEEVGVQAWFFDSYPNLAAMPVNYADPQLRPGIKRLWEFQAWCQERGVYWEIEGDGPFGIASCGIGGAGTGAGQHTGMFHGNFFSDYAGERAYSLIDANLRVEEKWIDAGWVDPTDYFRSLAARGPLCPITHPDAPTLWGWVTDDVVSWNRAYAQVRDVMDVPRLLPDDAGVIWNSASQPGAVIWSFGRKDLALPCRGQVTDLLSGEIIGGTEILRLRPWRAYRVDCW